MASRLQNYRIISYMGFIPRNTASLNYFAQNKRNLNSNQEEMETIAQKVGQKIEGILSQQCGGVKRTQIMAQLEGLSIIYTITSMVSEIEKEKQA